MDRVNYYNGMPFGKEAPNTVQDHAEAHLRLVGRLISGTGGVVLTGATVTVAGDGSTVAVAAGEAVGPMGERAPIAATPALPTGTRVGAEAAQWVTITARPATRPDGDAYQDILGAAVRQYRRDGVELHALVGAGADTIAEADLPEVPATDIILADIAFPSTDVSTSRVVAAGGIAESAHQSRERIATVTMSSGHQNQEYQADLDGPFDSITVSTPAATARYLRRDLEEVEIGRTYIYANSRLFLLRAGFNESHVTEIEPVGAPPPNEAAALVAWEYGVRVLTVSGLYVLIPTASEYLSGGAPAPAGTTAIGAVATTPNTITAFVVVGGAVSMHTVDIRGVASWSAGTPVTLGGAQLTGVEALAAERSPARPGEGSVFLAGRQAGTVRIWSVAADGSATLERNTGITTPCTSIGLALRRRGFGPVPHSDSLMMVLGPSREQYILQPSIDYQYRRGVLDALPTGALGYGMASSTRVGRTIDLGDDDSASVWRAPTDALGLVRLAGRPYATKRITLWATGTGA